MAFCVNCFLFDEFKLYSKVGFFETRKEMVIFMLNTILNIQKYILDFCKCDGENMCLSCEIAQIFDKKVTCEIYKNCLDLNFMSKIKENLHVQLNNLLEKHDHFLCTIINEEYRYEQDESIFTGEPISFSARTVYLEWEKMQIENIVNEKATIFVKKYVKE